MWRRMLQPEGEANVNTLRWKWARMFKGQRGDQNGWKRVSEKEIIGDETQEVTGTRSYRNS